MKIKLNFQVDKPTLNNRIYRREDIEKELKRLTKTGELFITKFYNKDGMIDSDHILGFSKDYDIDRYGNIFIECEPISEDLNDFINHDFSIQVIAAEVNEKNEVCNFKLVCVFPII